MCIVRKPFGACFNGLHQYRYIKFSVKMYRFLIHMDGDNKRLSRHETLDSNVTKNTEMQYIL